MSGFSKTWASNKQHCVMRQRFRKKFREVLASHQSWLVRKWPLPLYIYNNTTKKQNKKRDDYQKQCQHAEERQRAKSVTEVSSGLFWNRQQRPVSVTHCIPRNQCGRQEKASQSNMCWSSWKSYTILAAFNLILSDLTGLRDSKCMDKV